MPDGKRKSLLVNTVSNIVVLAVNVLIGIVLTPAMIRYTGRDGYGLWSLIWAVVGYYGVLNLGVNAAVVRYIARYSALSDAEGMNRTASSAMALFLGTGLVAGLISVAFPGVLADFFRVAGEKRSDFIGLVVILGITTGLSFPGNVLGAVLRAHERFIGYNFTVVVSELLRAGLFFYLLPAGYGLTGLAYATLASTAVRVGLHWLLGRRYLASVRYSVRLVDMKTIRTLTGFGFAVWIAYLCYLLRNQIDSIVIGRFLSVDLVGVYAVAALLIRYINRLSGSLTASLPPRFARLAASGGESPLGKAFLEYSNLLGIAGFGVGLVGILCAADFIGLWVGPGFTDAAKVFIILLVGVIPDFATAASYAALQALDRVKAFSWFLLAEGFVNLSLSLILVKPLGIIGVSLGTTIPILVNMLVVLPLYTARVTGVTYAGFLAACIGKPLVASLPPALLFLIPGVFPGSGTFAGLFLKGGAIAAAYALSVIPLGLSKTNRNLVLGKLQRLWKRSSVSGEPKG